MEHGTDRRTASVVIGESRLWPPMLQLPDSGGKPWSADQWTLWLGLTDAGRRKAGMAPAGTDH